LAATFRGDVDARRLVRAVLKGLTKGARMSAKPVRSAEDHRPSSSRSNAIASANQLRGSSSARGIAPTKARKMRDHGQSTGRAQVRDTVILVAGLATILAACRGPSQAPTSGASVGPPLPTSAHANDLLASIRQRLAPARPANGASARAAGAAVVSALPAGVADRFHQAGDGVEAHFASQAEDAPAARVRFPARATAAVHIEEVSSGASVDVSLRGARDVAADAADGYLVYEGAHASGGTVMHRPLPEGTEDWVSFPQRPAKPEVAYDIAIGAGISGLRLVERNLELLDATGAPRLRVAAPYIVGADGAKTAAVLAVDGCAVDRNPAAPWGRPVTAAGAKSCTVRVSWDDDRVAYPALLDPRWTTGGSMTWARTNHTATLLPTGAVLVAGGTDGTDALMAVELYDRASNTWSATGNLTVARQLHTAVLLGTSSNATTSGKVLVAGGLNGATSQNTAELYSPATGTWTAAANMNAARQQHTATLLASGKVLVAGGMAGTSILNTAAVYDPSTGTGTWTAVDNMSTARRAHTATLLVVPGNPTLNNKVLVVGGDAGGQNALLSVQLFDGTSSWTGAPSLSMFREAHTATALPNGNVLVVGGVTNGINTSSPLNTALLFDASSGSGAWSSAGTLSRPRLGHTATALPPGLASSGQVLVVGGANGFKSVELWNGASTWTQTQPNPGPSVEAHTATLLANNAVLIAGGIEGGQPLAWSVLYDASFGLGCTSNSQCSSGFCVSGVCCDTACTDACSSCNLPGTTGVCSPKPLGASCGDNSNLCNGAGTCSPYGTCVVGPAPQVNDNNPCTVDSCDPATGVSHVPVADGTTCDDNNLCTTGETCHAGTCGGGSVIACPGDSCHSAGTCDPATGFCSTTDTKPYDGLACDDGNRCTTGDSCLGGSCIPGTTNVCPEASYYIPVTNLGSQQGISYATGINKNGDVVGVDSHATYVPPGTGALLSQGFVWTKAGGMAHLPMPPGYDLFPRDINSSGVVAGTNVIHSNGFGQPFRFDPPYSQVKTLTYGGGLPLFGGAVGINEAGVIAGDGYFGTTHAMYRASGTVATQIPGPAGDQYQAASAIDELGDLVGLRYVANGGAVLCTKDNQFALLSQLVTPGLGGWDIDSYNTDSFANAYGTNGTSIVGWGYFGGGLKRGFVATPDPGASPPATATIKELGMISRISELDAVNYSVVPRAINNNGEVVGGIYDQWPYWPHYAFIWVDGTGIVDLNDLIDPSSGWLLIAAFDINDNREIVGYGSLNGALRAFKMQVPQWQPCTTPVDSCQPTKLNLRTGSCDPVTPPASCAKGISLHADGIVDTGGGHFVAVMGFDNTTTNSYHPKYNVETLDGVTLTSPQPPPPDTLPPGSHRGAFLPPFSSGQRVSWTVDDQTLTVSQSLPVLPRISLPGGGFGVNIGGKPVTIQQGNAPADPTADNATLPTTGDAFNGALTGSLSVSPSGAATYTVPIKMPPGVAGMAPALSLVYNSQGADGIAGMGWDLSGLSTITRCPRTHLQDGKPRPVTMAPLQAGADSDGLCLDGKRLFEKDGSPTAYSTDSDPYSDITRSADFKTFTVVTKSGETRYYALRDSSRAVLNGLPVIWALDRVQDIWGNYYDLDYNGSDANMPFVGFNVQSIKYTGHVMPGVSMPDVDAAQMNSITFNYDPRPEVRNVRFGGAMIQKGQRLTSIVTSVMVGGASKTYGTYSLKYPPAPAAPTVPSIVPSELTEIDYCATALPTPQQQNPSPQCLDPLKFTWTQNTNEFWPYKDLNLGYSLPAEVRAGKNLKGTQFVDINGDGLVDLVVAPHQASTPPAGVIYFNTGTGWDRGVTTFPTELTAQNDSPLGVRFADMDGDGLIDVVRDHADFDCHDNTPPVNDGSCTSPVTHISPAIWINQGGPMMQGARFKLARTFNNGARPTSGDFNGDVDFVSNIADILVDVDNDGRADFVRLRTPAQTTNTGTFGDITILLNTKQGWRLLDRQRVDTGIPDQKFYDNAFTYGFQDINRDGFPDLVARAYVGTEGAIDSAESVFVNLGMNDAGTALLLDTERYHVPEVGTLISAGHHPVFGDIDGDGFYDAMIYYPVHQVKTGNGDLNWVGGVGFGNGMGTISSATPQTGGFNGVVSQFSPAPIDPSKIVLPDDFGWSFVDANGDGLVDLVRNHAIRSTTTCAPGEAPPNCAAGELLLNTGSDWLDINGVPVWQDAAGTVPVVPDDQNLKNGAAFVDLDGDGMADLVQEAQVDGTPSRAWLNHFTPPVIEHFPSQMVNDTTVAYQVITTAAAQSGGAPTYTDTLQLGPGLKLMTVPLRVVQSTVEDTGENSAITTTYQYSNLRASAFGYGPQGFETMTATNTVTGAVTKTHFAQVYPYTGLPTLVEKSNTNLVQACPYTLPALTGQSNVGAVSATSTVYCTGNIDEVGPAPCADSPDAPQAYHPPQKAFFVRPVKVIDQTCMHASPASASTPAVLVETTTQFSYDTLGNPKVTQVDIHGMGEGYHKETQNTYGMPGSLAEKRGKATDTVVVTTKTAGAPADSRRHETRFEYGPVSPVGAFALSKTRVQPDSTEQGGETDTVYEYDNFGNVKTTSVCAGKFDQSGNCMADPTIDPAINPLRITQVSYDINDLPFSVTYGSGRFPTKITDAAGHRELTGYDPVTGQVAWRIDVNDIATCYAYDALGRMTQQTDHCASDHPLNTTFQRYRAPTPTSCGANCTPPFDPTKLITVTSPPGGSPSWVFSDGMGRTVKTVTRGFDGFQVQTLTEYDSLGRVHRASQPFRMTDATFWTTTTQYDSFDRPMAIAQDLGIIDGTQGGATAKTASVSMTYQPGCISSVDQGPECWEVATTRTVNGQPLTKKEDKNVAGKVVKTSDPTGAMSKDGRDGWMTFAYDVDGNLTHTEDHLGNSTDIVYDTRGRKKLTIDADAGTWQHFYDGFGDVVEEIDAKSNDVHMLYDSLGRMTVKRVGTDEAQWVYDQADGAGIGKLAAVIGFPDDERLKAPCTIPLTNEPNGNRAGRWYAYDSFGNMTVSNECVDGDTFSTTYAYDDLGRQASVTYPQVGELSLEVSYHYTKLGYLQYLIDEASGGVFWQAEAMDALGQVTQEQTQNGVETARTYNPSTGWMLGASSVAHLDADTVIQNWGYGFDEGGNLLRRVRADDLTTAGSDERFTYDTLERVKTSHVVTTDGFDHTDSYEYDSLGNLKTKGGNTYFYGTDCPDGSNAGPHAVCFLSNGVSFAYDPAGNMKSGNGRNITYDAFNKAVHIDGAGGGVDFIYGPEGNRVVQEATATGGTPARTVYVGLGGTGKSLYERTTTASGVEHVQFIYAGGAHGGSAFAVRKVSVPGSPAQTLYYHYDHLGSVTAMSDELGRVTDAAAGGADATIMGYDPWGQRRNPDGRSATVALHLQLGHREFTGHETIPDLGLVNMNGRIYDPVLGRFLSPDPNVQAVTNLQSHNRYSYALNNPLRYTDPTGYFWGELGGFFKSYFSNPLNIAELAGSLIACIGTDGIGCAIFGVEAAMFNASVAISEGAGFEQTVVNTAIGLGVGFATGGFSAGAGLKPMESVILGSASAAATTMISNAVSGRNVLGANVLGSAMLSAASGALTWGIGKAIEVSQASRAQAGGGGLAAMRQFLAAGGYQLSDPTAGWGGDEPSPPEPDPAHFATRGASDGGPLGDPTPRFPTLGDVPGCVSSPCSLSDASPKYSSELTIPTAHPDNTHYGVVFVGIQGVGGIATGGSSATFGVGFDMNGHAAFMLSIGMRIGPQFGLALGPTVAINPFLTSVYQMAGPYVSLNLDLGPWGGGSLGTGLPPAGVNFGMSPPARLRLPSLGFYFGATAELGMTQVW
jgi:RHS repeat-associated protein